MVMEEVEAKAPDQEALEVASDLAQKAEDDGTQTAHGGIVTLSNGIRLRTQPINVFAMRGVGQQFPEPKPPIVVIPMDNGKKRTEENLSDPAYRDRYDEWKARINEASMNFMLLTGTRIDHVPDEMHRPNDEAWIDALEAVGALPPDGFQSEPKRYLAWLRFYALSTTADYLKAVNAVIVQAGLKEVDVQKSGRSFPGGEERGADPEPAHEISSRNGDSVHGADTLPDTRA